MMSHKEERPHGNGGAENPAKNSDFKDNLSADQVQIQAQLTSGKGKYDTDKKRQLDTISFADIAEMLDNPVDVGKDFAPWALFTDVATRQSDRLKKEALYYALWLDIDEPGVMPFTNVVEAVGSILCADYMAYTSKSATADKQKCRFIIPLAQPVPFEVWEQLAIILNDKVKAKGITPDRKTEIANQIAYLPNRGAFYAQKTKTGSGAFNPSVWSEELADLLSKVEAEKAKRKRKAEKARQKCSEHTTGATAMDAYNNAVSLDDALMMHGYEQVAHNRWISPNSDSGSAGVVTFQESGMWWSAHDSDNAIGMACEGGRTGDAFDLCVYYTYNGDRNAALKAEGDRLMTAEGLTINNTQQREHMAQQAQEQAQAVIDEALTHAEIIAQEKESALSPIDIELTGLLGEIQDFCYKEALYQSRSLAGFTALSIFSAIAGHRNISPTGLKLNQYSIVMMPSGTGKDGYKDATRASLRDVELSYLEAGMGVSRQALHTTLQNKQIGAVIHKHKIEGDNAAREANSLIEAGKYREGFTILLMDDEFHKHLHNDKGNQYKAEMQDLLLQLYSEKFQINPTDAMTKKYCTLYQPAVSILGFSTPAEIVTALNAQSGDKGLIGRCMVYATPNLPVKNYDRLRNDWNMNLLTTDSTPYKEIAKGKGTIPWGAGGGERFEELDKAIFEPMKTSMPNNSANRIGEQVIKIATLMALSEERYNPAVTAEHIDKAWYIREQLFQHFMHVVQLEGGFGAGEFVKTVEQTRQTIKKHFINKGSKISHARLRENCASFRKMPTRMQQEVIQQLHTCGEVVELKGGRGSTYQWLGEVRE
ncbi:hypothetical protein JV46_25460 [Solemya velum gill symbiont]|uniref:DUF3987 domain-containing protein n=1 Tax=Solemya velum gill symbiont TaxID=2340 RepID=A0A0B0H9H1_SOVGS|nr:DUF3987 domain-containing protein [Solemya velum gill symbiont]KHF24514.1 hypothetical protein JV46_25460 [Solemya velum gill symbiont]